MVLRSKLTPVPLIERILAQIYFSIYHMMSEYDLSKSTL